MKKSSNRSSKRLLVRVLTTMLLLLFVLRPAISQNPWVYLNLPATLVPGQAVEIPVVIDTRGGTNIGSWNFLLEYNNTALTYQGITGNMGVYSGLFMASSTFPGVPPLSPANQIFKASFACFNAMGYPYEHKTVFTINFIYNGGNPEFSWFNVSAGGASNNETYVKSNPANVVNINAAYIINASVPVQLIVPATTVQPNQILCFNAIGHLTVGGGSSFFEVLNGGNVTLIAGEKITLLPGAIVNQGGYLHGYITQSWSFCGTQNTPIVAAASLEEDTKLGTSEVVVNQAINRVYPNPTQGTFTLESGLFSADAQVQVTLFSVLGEVKNQLKVNQSGPVTLSLEGQPTGIYLLRIKQGSNIQYIKVIKQ